MKMVKLLFDFNISESSQYKSWVYLNRLLSHYQYSLKLLKNETALMKLTEWK